MELANQQERRLADLHWFAGFFDGEGCLSIVQFKKRRFTQFSVCVRLVNSSDMAITEARRIMDENGLAYHVSQGGPSNIGSRNTWRLTISGYQRVARFLDVFAHLLRAKAHEAWLLRQFVSSRIAVGPKAPYSDGDIDTFIALRDLHGYRLNESSETTRQTLIERRYSPAS